MARLNHARHIHRGRPTERAFITPAKDHSCAKAATSGYSLSSDKVADWAAQNGFSVSSR